MSAKFFLDTNVLVYTFDTREPVKQARARELVETALSGARGLISYQVVQEFLNVATRRFERPLSPTDAELYLNQVLSPLCEVFPSTGLYRSALGVAARLQLAFYDSLIVAGALSRGCRVLYSEDLQHGQRIEGLAIVNPFLPVG